MIRLSKTTLPYLTTVIGVLILAAAQVWADVRMAMFMTMMQSGGYGSYGGQRHFGRFGFGGPNVITTMGVIVVVIGVIWLGLTLRKS